MNIACKYYKIKTKLSRIVQLIIYYIFQLPLWKFSYNTGGNVFKSKGRMYACRVRMEGKGNTLIIAERVLLFNVDILITGNNNKVSIDSRSIVYEKGRIRVEDEGNTVRIGKGVRIVDAFISSADKNTVIEIGDESLISVNVVIRSSDAHSILNSNGERVNMGENVFVGKHVWIGNGVTILKGSSIGDNAVVGTQSLVSGKSFPSNSVIVGNPARVVKNGVSWSKERI